MKKEKISTIEPNQYVGTKVKTTSAVFESGQFGKMIKITGEPMELKGDDSLPEGKTLNASKILGLGENKEGHIVIAEGSNTEKFLESKKIDEAKIPEFEEGKEVEALIGIECVVQKNVKNNFLDLV